MILHIFRCSNRQMRLGLTPDRTGANLSATTCHGGNWTFSKTIHVNPGERGFIGTQTADEILAAIARDGYYINDATIEFRETEM
jgi:hypothetical protein